MEIDLRPGALNFVEGYPGKVIEEKPYGRGPLMAALDELKEKNAADFAELKALDVKRGG